MSQEPQPGERLAEVLAEAMHPAGASAGVQESQAVAEQVPAQAFAASPGTFNPGSQSQSLAGPSSSYGSSHDGSYRQSKCLLPPGTHSRASKTGRCAQGCEVPQPALILATLPQWSCMVGCATATETCYKFSAIHIRMAVRSGMYAMLLIFNNVSKVLIPCHLHAAGSSRTGVPLLPSS